MESTPMQNTVLKNDTRQWLTKNNNDTLRLKNNTILW